MTEDQFLEAVAKRARDLGWVLHHDRRSDKALQMGDRGFPDLVLARERVLWVELKDETGKLRPEQVEWRDRLIGAGMDWRLWRPREWSSGEIERILSR